MRTLTLQDWVNKANKVHHFKYDYSQAVYFNTRSMISIICPIHGLYSQTANSHLNGRGCAKCSSTAPVDLNIYFDRFYKKHGDKYNYSKSVIIGNWKKIIIICPIHGEFKQAPQQHFIQGCPSCAGVKKLTTQEFIEKSILVHGQRYDYSESEYVTRPGKIKIICHRHGAFWQTANCHLVGHGCVKCSASVSRKETKWLDLMKVPNDNLHRNVIIFIDNKKYNVDGYLANSKTIYEFLGDYWHGNPNVYSAKDFNINCKKTFGELFLNTELKLNKLKEHGFQIISIWESEFDKGLK